MVTFRHKNKRWLTDSHHVLVRGSTRVQSGFKSRSEHREPKFMLSYIWSTTPPQSICQAVCLVRDSGSQPIRNGCEDSLAFCKRCEYVRFTQCGVFWGFFLLISDSILDKVPVFPSKVDYFFHSNSEWSKCTVHDPYHWSSKLKMTIFVTLNYKIRAPKYEIQPLVFS